MKLLIHTPISNRAWILPEFLDALEAQDIPKSETVVCFDVNESEDETLSILEAFARKSRGVFADVLVRQFKWSERLRLPDHTWNPELYRRMIQMRNGALLAAHQLRVAHLFSIDSDVIMKDPGTINHLILADKPIIAGVFTAVWGNPEAKVSYDALYNLPSNYRGEDRYFCIRAVAAHFPLFACAHKRIEHRDKPKN